HDLAGCRLPANVARSAEADVRCREQPNGMTPSNLRCPVARTVVDDDDLEVGIIQPPQRLQALGNRPRAVVGTEDDRDTWPALVVRERHDTIRGAHRRQRGLRPPLLVGETKGPVVNILPASIPLIGPRENKGAGAPT